MTDLKKIVRRKVESRSLRHPLIIQLEPGGILKLREKGARRWYEISLEALYKRLVVAAVREEKANKRRRK